MKTLANHSKLILTMLWLTNAMFIVTMDFSMLNMALVVLYMVLAGYSLKGYTEECVVAGILTHRKSVEAMRKLTKDKNGH